MKEDFMKKALFCILKKLNILFVPGFLFFSVLFFNTHALAKEDPKNALSSKEQKSSGFTDLFNLPLSEEGKVPLDLNKIISQTVVKIIANGRQGTGFFIDPTTVVTTAHNVSTLKGFLPLKDIKVSLAFTQGEESGPLFALMAVATDPGYKKKEVVGIKSLFLEKDLVALEVTWTAGERFRLAPEKHNKNRVGEIVYIPGFPLGEEVLIKGQIVESGESEFIISTNFSVLNGVSGSAVFNELGEVIGLVYRGMDNILYAVNLKHLRSFVEEIPTEPSFLTSLFNNIKNDLRYPPSAEYTEYLYLNEKDIFSKQWSLLQQKVMDGSAKAGLSLAFMYLAENMTEKAVELISSLAEAGNPTAQYLLGFYYATGDYGVEKNDSLAFKWSSKALSNGYGLAEHNVASLFWGGIGVEQDIQKAKHHFRNSAKNYMHAGSMYSLGLLYYTGDGGETDYVMAGKAFELATVLRYPSAGFMLGKMYLDGNLTGESGDLDYERAYQFFKMAGSLRDPLALRHLGIMYEKGLGVPVDKEISGYWHHKADLMEKNTGHHPSILAPKFLSRSLECSKTFLK